MTQACNLLEQTRDIVKIEKDGVTIYLSYDEFRSIAKRLKKERCEALDKSNINQN